jgi:serine/threonine-protein kinase RsbW
MVRLTIPARVDRLPELCAFLHSGAEAAGLAPPQIDQLDLVLEELFMNIARHAYAPAQGDVEIAYAVEAPGALLVEISDAGRPFNPLASDPPDFSLSLADRPSGGMGVFLIRQMTNSLCYQRQDGRNRVTFLFRAPCQNSSIEMQ